MRIQLKSTHNDSDILGADKDNIFFTDKKEALARGIAVDFYYAKPFIVINNKGVCGYGANDAVLTLCKFILDNQTWEVLHVGSDSVKLFNTEMGRCIGYSEAVNQTRPLEMVDCMTTDKTVTFKITYPDRATPVRIETLQTGPVNLFTGRSTGTRTGALSGGQENNQLNSVHAADLRPKK